MNHRKVRSRGYIPFSWEEKPGIPKFIIHHHKSSSQSDMNILVSENVIAPPPPCTTAPRKGLRWQDDPFLAALKSCSKGDHMYKDKISLISKSTTFFSCKHSCNVVNDNLVNFSNLPPIPKQRYYAKSFVRNSNSSS